MIFVTGASGLVGAHLIQSLIEKGKPVIALYRKEIPSFKHSDKVIWRQGDILDIISLQEAMQAAQKKSIISFGGAWSNHLVALAYYAHHYQIPCKAIVRGHYEVLSPSLLFAQEHGMELHFVDATHYSALKKDASSLQSKYPDAYILPEGGNSEMGVNGASAIASFLTKSYDYVCVSVGSGTTFAGLRRALSLDTHLIGFAPMKGGDYLKNEIEENPALGSRALRLGFEYYKELLK